jgi:hypothetical protein
MEIGSEIKLKPISKHGKDRVNQFGKLWILKSVVDKVGFDERKGPWLGLTDSGNKKDFRWVKLNQDKNFEIVL